MKMSRALLTLFASCMFTFALATTGCDSMGNHDNDGTNRTNSSMQNSNSRNGVSGTGTGNSSGTNTQTGAGGSSPNGGLDSQSGGNPNGVTRDAGNGVTGNR